MPNAHLTFPKELKPWLEWRKRVGREIKLSFELKRILYQKMEKDIELGLFKPQGSTNYKKKKKTT